MWIDRGVDFVRLVKSFRLTEEQLDKVKLDSATCYLTTVQFSPRVFVDETGGGT